MKTKPKKPLRGKALFDAVLKHIAKHPDEYSQNVIYHCGTKHCFGGLAQILAGFPADKGTAPVQAEEALGIARYESWKIFSMSRSLKQIKDFKPPGGWHPTI